MGLDMYLYKKTYVKRHEWQKPEETYEVTVKKGGEIDETIKPERVSEVREDMGYWRKANAIHGWIVDNVQSGKDECQTSWFSIEKMRELLELVNKVLDSRIMAPDLLPVLEGFFFGGDEYDEYYFETLEDTKKILTECLKDPQGDYYYHSSW